MLLSPESMTLVRSIVEPRGRGGERGIFITADDISSVPPCHSTSRLPKLFGQFPHLFAELLGPNRPKILPSPDNPGSRPGRQGPRVPHQARR